LTTVRRNSVNTEAEDLTRKEWLTPAEATPYSNIKRTRMYGLLNSGELRSSKVGRTLFVRQTDIDRFLEERTED
jgi:excisionase family DNA binding protein